MEAFDDCNDQQIGVSIEGSVSTELHHENEKSMLAAETNLEAEGNDNTLQLEAFVPSSVVLLNVCRSPLPSEALMLTMEVFLPMMKWMATSLISNYIPFKIVQKKHNEMEKNGKWHRDEPLEPVMQHRLPRSWPRPKRDRYPSQVPLSQRAPLRGYESACPSHESRVEFPFDSALHPFEKAKYSEEENMKMLRMVHELQDQISRTCNLNGKTNVSASTDIPWKQKHYNNHHEPPDDENFYAAYNGKRGWNQRCRISHVPFSESAINTRHGIDNTCSCFHPQAWKHSQQLPPPMFPQNRGFCRAGPGHSCYNSYSSFPLVPEDIWSLLFLIGPLQLPADFLLFKRRFHQLRCGACSKVLKFSLQNGSHIIPYELVAAEPPLSEVEDCSHAINARISGFASSSRGCMQAYHFSYSNDYGHSFNRSCSTDGNTAKFHHLQNSNAYVQNMPSSSSKPMETFHSGRPSRSKKVLGIEGSQPRTRGSMLHRLTGNSSLSQVLKGRRPSISDTSSLHSGRKTQD
ncbi:hypothetical protein V6N13_116236 [Hibiscus sabdariffa]